MCVQGIPVGWCMCVQGICGCTSSKVVLPPLVQYSSRLDSICLPIVAVCVAVCVAGCVTV